MTPLVPVKSSMLSHVGYDAGSRVFAARFVNSNFVHHYKDVPPEVAAAVLHIGPDESIGKTFNAHIKGKFDSTPIAVDEPAGEPASA